jgi:hypothetical protein
LSLPEIVDSIRRERPGSLAEVEGPSIGPDGEPHYRLKWLMPNGRVEWLDRPARRSPPGPNAGPQRRPLPPSASDQRRNLRPPPEAYVPPQPRPNLGQPGGPPTRFRQPPPGVGADPRFRGGRPPPQRQEFSPGPPPEFAGPPPGFDRPPPRNRGIVDRPPPPRNGGNFDRPPPPRSRGDFGQAPPRARGNFSGGPESSRRPPPPPRAPDGDPRGPRRYR